MNPFYLVAIDLMFSALIVGLAAHLFWRRVRSYLALQLSPAVPARSVASVPPAVLARTPYAPKKGTRPEAAASTKKAAGAPRNGRKSAADKAPVPARRAGRQPTAGNPVQAWAAGRMAEEVARMKQQGQSVEKIAQSFETSTAEIEMLLACSQMGQKSKPGPVDMFTSSTNVLQPL